MNEKKLKRTAKEIAHAATLRYNRAVTLGDVSIWAEFAGGTLLWYASVAGIADTNELGAANPQEALDTLFRLIVIA